MIATRVACDSFGGIAVPAAALWGAQTQRSLQFFAIGEQRMPLPVIHAMASVKSASALVNCELGLLSAVRANAIADAADRVAAGEFDGEFPLSVWQTGSGTQSHMNVNEVVARIATQSLASKDLAPRTSASFSATETRAIHPNDDVNVGQSSNDVFPTAMHLAVVAAYVRQLQPALGDLRTALTVQAGKFAGVVKIGRTHLQDATPVTLGQEFGGYAAQLALCEASLRYAMVAVHSLAIGGTAVGTGLNTHPEFGSRVAAVLARRFDAPLVQAANLFAAMAGHEALVALHSGLKMLAIALLKIGSDLRLMGSGPRAGLGELHLPENEPGSSIMPGKVNPTQIEALAMVCAQVIGHDAAIGFAASQGQFELNVYKPLIAMNTLDSMRLLADAMRSFERHCVAGLAVNAARIDQLLHSSLMLVTALAPHIGYDRAAQVAKHAHDHGTTLRDAALALGVVGVEQFDAWVVPQHMVGTALPESPPADSAGVP
jgi:fumarate hydratase, class II